jgi:hypothetical protein
MINEVVRHGSALGRGWFGCSNGHFPIKLTAVAGQDFCAEALCCANGESSFAAGCRAANNKEIFLFQSLNSLS